MFIAIWEYDGSAGREETFESAYGTIGDLSVFFFQAEDGIRDYKVTGVQTCALPISEFIEGIRSAGVNVSDSDKLIALRIHGVSPEFISGIRSAGLNVLDSDKLIAFRIHGVTTEMVGSLKQAGYNPDSDKLIAMRIHRAA